MARRLASGLRKKPDPSCRGQRPVREATDFGHARVPLMIRPRPRRMPVITQVREGVAALTTPAEPALVKALARAFRYEGRYTSICEMAVAEKLERGYLGSLLRLTLLPPVIVEAILDGRQPGGMSLSGLMQPFSVEWEGQPRHYRPDAAGQIA